MMVKAMNYLRNFIFLLLFLSGSVFYLFDGISRYIENPSPTLLFVGIIIFTLLYQFILKGMSEKKSAKKDQFIEKLQKSFLFYPIVMVLWLSGFIITTSGVYDANDCFINLICNTRSAAFLLIIPLAIITAAFSKSRPKS